MTFGVKTVKDKACRTTEWSVTLTLFAIAPMVPMLVNGVVWGHDTVNHTRWSYYFAQQLFSGDLYPRWILALNDGFGSPVFYFYPPLAYYLTAPLYLFTTDPLASEYIVALSLAASFVVSAFAMRLWLEEIVSPMAAWAGAVLYVALPYHATIDASLRLAFTETWAFAWAPVIFAGVDRARRSEKEGFLLTLVGCCCLVLTHPPTALMVIPFSGAYALVQGLTHRDRHTITRFLLAVACGFGVCAFYLIPAFGLQQFQHAHWTHFSFRNAFLFQAPVDIWLGAAKKGNIDGFLTTWAVLSVVGCSLIALFVFRSSRRTRALGGWLGLLAAVAFVLQTRLALPLWEALPLIDNLQFPWRFGVVQTLLFAALYAVGFDTLDALPVRLGRWGRQFQAGGLVLSVALIGVSTFFNIEICLGPIGDATANIEEAFAGMPEAPEYELAVPPALDLAFGATTRALLLGGKGTVNVTQWDPGEVHVVAKVHESGTLAIRRGFFSGWDVEDKETSAVTPATALRDSDLVGLDLPLGDHTLVFRPTTTGAEYAGRWLTALSCFALCVFVWRAKKRVPEKEHT